MAYRHSITSSDDDSATGPKWSAPSSDSSDSAQSGTSAKYEWMWDYTRRRERLPQTPSPVESFEDDQENIHPALVDRGEPEESEDEEDPSEDEEDPSEYPVYQGPQNPIEISDEELQEVIQRFEAQESYSGPPGFGAGSSAAADLQQHLNVTNHRIEELEGKVGEREYAAEAFQAENQELAERVAQLSVGFVMMGMGADATDAVNGSLWMAVAVLLVMVVALLIRGWL